MHLQVLSKSYCRASIGAVTLAMICLLQLPGQANTSFESDDSITEYDPRMDRATQKLLDKSAADARLTQLQQEFEKRANGDSTKSTDTGLEARWRLLMLYPKLGLRQKADELALWMEEHEFDASYNALENYYSLYENRKRHAIIIKRHLALKANELDSNLKTLELIRLGDIHYRLNQIKQAEENYKAATKLAISNMTAPNTATGQPGAVCIGAFNSYGCFLAMRGQLKEAMAQIDKAMDFRKDPHYNCMTGYGGDDQFSTFGEIIKAKDPSLYASFIKRWHQVFADNLVVGLLDSQGKEVTGPRFAKISAFTEGLAAAQDNVTRRYGYIDSKGNWAIKPVYLAANPFYGGTAFVKPAGSLFPIDMTGQFKYAAMIDKTGKTIKNLPVYLVQPFNANISLGTMYDLDRLHFTDIIDSNGDSLYCGTPQIIKAKGDSLELFFSTGSEIRGCLVSNIGYKIDCKIEPDPANPGHNRLVQVTDNNSNKPAQEKSYQELFRDESAPVQTSKTKVKNDSLFTYCRDFHEGLAAANFNDLWGFVNTQGKVVIPIKYSEVGDFQNSLTFYRRASANSEIRWH
ncbi:MAG: WG repeat-containing protein [Candidatus Obscuribacter sp.]|jgi:tetratricopeptide (TPR) repeat protein|nr:WG repeat-containing protein [Candidatus Obscuribacter sp.]MBK9620989.1 WG repeat-containing protein [Candidatus Obscuribacter sp.]MBL0185517.1 WG repeat-containing protein [Candidatus Obscuribacter sp.]MBP6348051.1 WG repeat-containing protein [Candidatus Obscuribacter sp.]MBP7575072.1 WG repeat-containing protein [Candidatus Obscuribacter sp.]